MNLVTLIHGFSCLISLEIVGDEDVLKNLGQFKCVIRETRYHIPIAEFSIQIL